jgi:hypothetical protein
MKFVEEMLEFCELAEQQVRNDGRVSSLVKELILAARTDFKWRKKLNDMMETPTCNPTMLRDSKSLLHRVPAKWGEELNQGKKWRISVFEFYKFRFRKTFLRFVTVPFALRTMNSALPDWDGIEPSAKYPLSLDLMSGRTSFWHSRRGMAWQ